MRHFPEDKDDRKEAKRLGAKPWMLELLKLNPSYVFWGPYEDYMAKRGRDEGEDAFGRTGDHGWESRVFIDSWSDFDWELDELNECVNYYFCIERANRECEDCGGSGIHPHALWVADSWYKHTSPFRTPSSDEVALSLRFQSIMGTKMDSSPLDGMNFPPEDVLALYSPAFREFCEEMRDGDGYWYDKLTQDEVDALVSHNRLRDFTNDWSKESGWTPKKNVVVTAKEVNAWARSDRMGHDSSNHWIAVEQRLNRLGLPHKCTVCDGNGYIYTEPEPHLSLVLWMIHPRKGAARGVLIRHVGRSDVKKAAEWLAEAQRRNTERFAKVAAFAKQK